MSIVRKVFVASCVCGVLCCCTASALAADWIPWGDHIYYIAGRVGIGTSTPASRLHVSGNMGVDIRLEDTAVADAVWRILPQTGNTTKLFRIYDQSAAANRLVIDAAGNIGIGTTSPVGRLQIGPDTGDNTNAVILSGDVRIVSWGSDVAYLGARETGSTNVSLQLRTQYAGDNVDVMRLTSSGYVGVGTPAPTATLDVRGRVRVDDTQPNYDVWIQGGATQSAGDTRNLAILGNTVYDRLHINWGNEYTGGVVLEGNVGIGRSASRALDVNGTTRTTVLEITGSDLSEQFDVAAAGVEPQPGHVVCIDPDNPGKLVVSTKAYDRRVAGIISGAGNVSTGIKMGQPGTIADGAHLVAISGRVYAWADASQGAIEPGDLLTTSDTPGHVIKVTDHAKAQGATIGKAMTRLESGQGLVLVLVALQ